VLRPCNGKTDCIILDHGNCTEYHGFLTDPDRIGLTGKTGGERATPTRTCKSCHARYAGNPKFCPQCGALLIDGEQRTDEEITLGDASYEMVETKRHQIPIAQVDKLYVRDLQTAFERGYRPGWADMRYKQRTGRWPDRDLEKEARVKTKFEQIDGRWTKTWAPVRVG